MAAEDLRTLAWLHAGERSPEVLADLYGNGFPKALTLLAPNDPWLCAMEAALRALATASSDDDGEELVAASNEDELAADFAAIYLTFQYRISPHESVWRDEDHLMLQAPTFAVRAFYHRHGLRVANWRQRADDHLATELEFVAMLLERGKLQEAANFLDAHLLVWLPSFAARVSQRAATPFYASLAGITLTACENCATRLPQPIAIAAPPAQKASSACSGVRIA